MKKRILRIVALLLCVVLLAGCGGGDLEDFGEAMEEAVGTDSVVTYEDMAYTRPDMEVLEDVLDKAIQTAAGEDVWEIIDMVYAFYDVYDSFYTNLYLADIRYCGDLTDTYWEAEYNFCMDNSARVDAALEELYYALAKSPCLERLESEKFFGPGYFDAYQGENMWDEAFTALLEREAELQSRYYELQGLGNEYEIGSEEYYSACGGDMAEVLVELIRLRHEIAAYWGYDDYAQFATDFYYYRDYTVDQSEEYLAQIQQELVELYRQVNRSGIWETGFVPCTEAETYAYVEGMARNMGGLVEEAFDLMDRGGLYDISYGENKYNSSFEVYLTSYYEPFVFMNPSLSTYDYLTFAHEFGHFCNDYASYGSYAGVDVLEVFSQGLEYLSLCYVDGTEDLTKLKMADSLCLYVEQAAFASFEMRMYAIPEEKLTVDALEELYDQVALEFGFDSIGYDPREFVTINHYYTNPLYILSYVVSNDAALQLYQMEKDYAGDGLACYEVNLDTQEYYFLSFLESAGLESPFAEGRIQSVRETFEEILG